VRTALRIFICSLMLIAASGHVQSPAFASNAAQATEPNAYVGKYPLHSFLLELKSDNSAAMDETGEEVRIPTAWKGIWRVTGDLVTVRLTGTSTGRMIQTPQELRFTFADRFPTTVQITQGEVVQDPTQLEFTLGSG
jgi:hypothetical protein